MRQHVLRSTGLVSALLFAVAAPATADTIALSSTRTSGNQSWTGALGMDFDVLAAITVTQLGAFDSGQNGFAQPVQVGIFDRNSGLLQGVSAVLSGTSNALVGNQRFADVADFNLGIGNYSIVAVGFGSNEQNGNTHGAGSGGPTIDTGGGLISFVGKSRYNAAANTALAFPTIVDGGPANRYDAGTFQFTAAVPEPGAYGLALAGMGVVAFAMQRRRRTGE